MTTKDTEELEVDLDSEETHAVDAVASVFEAVGSTFVDKDTELTALRLALVSGHHVILEGPHGTAKSDLCESVFKRITGGRLFSQQFMKGTATDEIFGPVDSKLYREKAIYQYATKGMLPEAHFAYLDEVYRASDMALPSMMRILNERKFINGRKHMKCPLITAVGTCNFRSDHEELEAFHDRWLISVDVSPLESTPSRVKMFNRFLSKESETITGESKFSLNQLRALNKRVETITFDEELLEAYDQVIEMYVKAAGNPYISDRRRCWGIRLIQAQAVLDDVTAVSAPMIENAQYALIKVGDDAQTQFFGNAFQKVIGTLLQEQQEAENWDETDKYVIKAETAMQKPMTAKKKAENLASVSKVLVSLQNVTATDRPKTKKQADRFAGFIQRLEALRLQLQA